MGRLVDDLYEMTRLEYLSDTVQPRNWGIVLEVLQGIPEAAYSREDWLEAYQYITGDGSKTAAGKKDLIKALQR